MTELPYFREGINFMAPQTDLPTAWDSYHNEHSRPSDESGIKIYSHDVLEDAIRVYVW